MTSKPDGDSPSVQSILLRLEARLESLESRLDLLEGKRPVEPVKHAPPAEAAAPASPEPIIPPVVTAPPEPAAPAPQPARLPADLPPLVIPDRYRPSPIPRPAPRPVTNEAATLESKIGRQWAAWVGGLIVLAGVLFALKLAWDAGWFRPGPTARIIIASVFGLSMIVAGQLLLKMRALAASLTGAGIAILMATMFAANVAFEVPVLTREQAFGAVIAVGALGIVLSLRMRLMPLSILALLGMYISPIILGSHEDKSLQLLVYLAAVTATGLVISFFKRTWFALRGVAFAGGWLWMFAWSIAMSASHGDLGRLMTALFFLMFLAEMTGSLARFMAAGKRDAAPDRPLSPNTLLLESGASVLTFLNTSLAMSCFALIYRNAGLSELWIVPLVLAALMTVASLVTQSKPFKLASIIQAMALVVLAVPLYFHHAAITFAWGILGLALAVYGHVTGNKLARAWMFVMLVLVTVRVFAFDAFNPDLHDHLFTLQHQKIDCWLLMCLSGGLYALVIGWLGRTRNDDENTRTELDLVPVASSALGTALWCAGPLAEFIHGSWMMTALVLWAFGLLAYGRLVKAMQALTVQAAFTMLVLTVAIPFYFEHTGVMAAWAAVGLLMAIYTYVTDEHLTRVWTLLMLILVCVRTLVVDSGDPWLKHTVFSFLGEEYTRWMLMTFAAAFYALLLGWLGRERIAFAADGTSKKFGAVWMTTLCAIAGTVLWCSAAVAGMHSGNALSLALAVWVLTLLGAGYLTVSGPNVSAVEGAALVLLMALNVKWAIYDGLGLSVNDVPSPEASPGHGPVWPMLNVFVLNGVLMSLAILAARLARQAGRWTQAWWIAALAFVVINIEAIRAVDFWFADVANPWLLKQATISVLWGLTGLTGILLGFSRNIPSIRWVALVLLGATVSKVLLVDMAHVEKMYRVMSFLAVGMVLLVVSFVYHKVGAKLFAPRAPAAEG